MRIGRESRPNLTVSFSIDSDYFTTEAISVGIRRESDWDSDWSLVQVFSAVLNGTFEVVSETEILKVRWGVRRTQRT